MNTRLALFESLEPRRLMSATCPVSVTAGGTPQESPPLQTGSWILDTTAPPGSGDDVSRESAARTHVARVFQFSP